MPSVLSRLLVAGVFLSAACFAQDTPPGAVFVPYLDVPRDEITPAQRAAIWREIDAAQARLALPKAGAHPSLRFPLRASHGYSDPAFDTIANNVDHDPAYPDKLLDYNCGARTYDLPTGYNHRGTDLGIWPDGWHLMSAGQVEIVAAAPGTILSKLDGNFDQNCAMNNLDWNAVYVQHDDGSIAWYGHMKRGSLTTKAVGERVDVGEYLGAVGSSGSSTAPHLHFEVYDASRRLIDPYAGQCNNLNSDSWWAVQPPYLVTRVNRVLTASAPPVFATCGADGRMQDPGNWFAKSAFRPGEQINLVATLRDVVKGQTVHFTVRRPDGSVWLDVTTDPLGDSFTAAYWYLTRTLDATSPPGTWLMEAELGGTKAQTPFTVTPSGAAPANYTDIWWNAAESGWGVNVIHQGDILFATWFTYDTDREGMWLAVTASLQPDGSYTGTLYRTTGIAFDQINGQPAVSGMPPSVGAATFRFASTAQGTFSYVVNGVAQQKAITREPLSTPSTACVFTAGTRAFATNYQDLWWNPGESGWGVNVAHQGDTLFVTWFTYRAGGRGQWLVGSNVTRQPTGEYRGTLYRTTGTPFNLINGAPALTTGITNVGQVALTFTDGEHARMDYTVDGISQSKSITRQVFATLTPLCR